MKTRQMAIPPLSAVILFGGFGITTMNIRLGNLTVAEMEKRAGVTFPDELKQLLATSHQDHATNIGKGEWHCFDMPFVLVCGGIELAQEIYDHMKAMSAQFTEPLQIVA